MVDADGHLAEQAAAAVRVGQVLPGPHETRRIHILPDQGIRNAAGRDISKGLPPETAPQVAAVQAVDQRFQRILLQGE